MKNQDSVSISVGTHYFPPDCLPQGPLDDPLRCHFQNSSAVRVRARGAACAPLSDVWGLAFGVWGLGFGLCGLGFGAWDLGCGAWGLGFRVWGFRLEVWGLGLSFQGLGFGVRGLEFGVWVSGFRVLVPEITLFMSTQVGNTDQLSSLTAGGR